MGKPKKNASAPEATAAAADSGSAAAPADNLAEQAFGWIQPGIKIKLEGLKKNPELEGRRGTVIKKNDDGTSWICKLQGMENLASIHPQFMRRVVTKKASFFSGRRLLILGGLLAFTAYRHVVGEDAGGLAKFVQSFSNRAPDPTPTTEAVTVASAALDEEDDEGRKVVLVHLCKRTNTTEAYSRLRAAVAEYAGESVVLRTEPAVLPEHKSMLLSAAASFQMLLFSIVGLGPRILNGFARGKQVTGLARMIMEITMRQKLFIFAGVYGLAQAVTTYAETTGAFEVSVGGTLAWSTISAQRLPSVEDLVAGLQTAGVKIKQ
mmetsp:Transcript_83165/g.222272  ORF Transcript_83165/g.222272 Transcript_83165/m.222272 type:complete len:321 (+) Transcript_83165:23-985(+)